MSRSEFISRAVARYLDELDAESLTQQIDQSVAGLNEDDAAAADAVAVGHQVLAGAADEW